MPELLEIFISTKPEGLDILRHSNRYTTNFAEFCPLHFGIFWFKNYHFENFIFFIFTKSQISRKIEFEKVWVVSLVACTIQHVCTTQHHGYGWRVMCGFICVVWYWNAAAEEAKTKKKRSVDEKARLPNKSRTLTSEPHSQSKQSQGSGSIHQHV